MTEISEILLEETFDEKGRYLGKIVILREDLTPELIKKLKEDKEFIDKNPKWKEYKKILKEKGYDV